MLWAEYCFRVKVTIKVYLMSNLVNPSWINARYKHSEWVYDTWYIVNASVNMNLAQNICIVLSLSLCMPVFYWVLLCKKVFHPLSVFSYLTLFCHRTSVWHPKVPSVPVTDILNELKSLMTSVWGETRMRQTGRVKCSSILLFIILYIRCV